MPDINDFLSGIKLVLKRDGVFTCEFPHLANLIKFKQFDTIYHEHYSYLSLGTVQKIFAHHKMDVFRTDEIPTHGGSLRVLLATPVNELFKIMFKSSLKRRMLTVSFP